MVKLLFYRVINVFNHLTDAFYLHFLVFTW